MNNLNRNPFTSETYSSLYLKSFSKKGKVIKIPSLDPLVFIKKKIPLYHNVGKTHTKILWYNADKICANDFKKKTVLIRDIPTYLNTNKNVLTHLKITKIRQHKGYLINLKNYKNAEEYFKAQFSGKRFRKLKKDKRRFENNFDVSYRMYSGNEITSEKFDLLFDSFIKFTEKREAIKKEFNHLLLPGVANFKREIFKDFVLKNNANIFVIYADEIPVSISFNVIIDNIIIADSTAFNPDFSKYGLGKLDIFEHLNWCIDNGFEAFDLSKGDYKYKSEWSNVQYDFESHIIYDPKSFFASFISISLGGYLKAQQFLRDLGINKEYHKIRGKLKRAT